MENGENGFGRGRTKTMKNTAPLGVKVKAKTVCCLSGNLWLPGDGNFSSSRGTL